MPDDAPKKDYPVFLPRTDFPMRANLPEREPEILARWEAMGLYQKVREASRGRPPWVLHWGPPYANGNIHIGHAFTKSLKDTVNRSMQMAGRDAPLVPGWDCHGLPIEWKVEEAWRAEGRDKDADPLAFRAACRAFAQGWVEAQKGQMRRLGVCADWDGAYLTMDPAAEAAILAEIYRVADAGLLYRGEKPVMWSSVERTALAEAEVEYKEHKSTAVWVKFPIVKAADPDLIGANIVIWTTTPWTIPGNRAIAYSNKKSFGYFLLRTEKGNFIVNDDLIEDFVESLKFDNILETRLIKGSPGPEHWIICAHPLRERGYDFEVPVLPADFVDNETGTGFVHIAPGHGADDYNLGKSAGLPIESAVDGDGYYTAAHPLFAGKQVFANELHKAPERDADIAVIKALAAAGALLHKASYRHDYPHSWRSGAPVLFRTTPQWFIAMDKTYDPPLARASARGGNTLRKTALREIEKTQFVPAQGQNRIRAMVEQRPDWCISRQRAWGVPIALFVHTQTGEVLRDPAVDARVLAAFRTDGADAWWARDAAAFLGPEHNATDYEQVFDIVDVWFESGATHAFVLEARGMPWPADLYLEGSDQHRGWFQSSLLEACATRGAAPYRAVLTHGFIVDEKGYKMSKSRGNVIAPEDLIATYGADIIRLWAITVDYTRDVPVGDALLKSVADLYRRLRGTLRFLLGALDGYTPAERVAPADMPALERYILSRLAALDAEIQRAQSGYTFGAVAHALHQFCNADLSAFYFDIRKDCLYCDAPDDHKRKSARSVLEILFDALVTRLAPIAPFTAEEAWAHRPPALRAPPPAPPLSGGGGAQEAADSVHLRTFAPIDPAWADGALDAQWARLRDVRRVVLGAMEPYRKDKTIGSSLEAAPVVHAAPDWAQALQGVDLAEVCITSAAPVTHDPAPADAFALEGVPGVAVAFARAPGAKCARCWKVLPEVTGDLCPRCARVLAGGPS
jgi:isoleucyl-tRNA synthetase